MRKKQEIDYATAEKETVEIDEIYHTIIVPKYGEYTVRLSGTQCTTTLVTGK